MTRHAHHASLLLAPVACGPPSSRRSLVFVFLLALPFVAHAQKRTALDEVLAHPARFPSKAELDALASAPRPSLAPSGQEVAVASWNAGGPFPTTWAPVAVGRTDDPFLTIGQRVAKRRKGVVVTEAAVCMARELGRFFLVHQGAPLPELKGWIARMCALSQEPRLLWQAVQADLETEEQEVVDALTKGLEEGLGKIVVDGDELGLWYGRIDGVAVVMMVAAPRKTIFDAGSNEPAEDGSVVVSGTLRLRAQSVFALANDGRNGVSRCTADEKVKLPKFRFRCRVDSADGATMIELGATPPGRIISERLGFLLARRPEKMPMVWTAPASVEEPPPAEALRRDALLLVNERRRAAGLRPLREVPAQSRAVESLAPAFFVAGKQGAPASWTERVMLGVLAGHELPGRLQDAWISASESSTVSAPALFAALFEQPGARRTLMEPDASLAALGVTTDARGAGLLVATYDPLEPGEEQTLLDEAVARWTKGRPKVTRLAGAEPALREAAEKIAAGENPQEVLPAALDAAAEVAGQVVRGGAAWAESLLDLDAPEPIASLKSGALAVATAWARTDSPWGRYVVVFAVAER